MLFVQSLIELYLNQVRRSAADSACRSDNGTSLAAPLTSLVRPGMAAAAYETMAGTLTELSKLTPL